MVERGVSIEEIANNIFVSLFQNNMGNRKVLEMEPQNFNKALLVSKEFDNHESYGKSDFYFTKFGVQMYDLPLHVMIEGVDKYLGVRDYALNKLYNCI